MHHVHMKQSCSWFSDCANLIVPASILFFFVCFIVFRNNWNNWLWRSCLIVCVATLTYLLVCLCSLPRAIMTHQTVCHCSMEHRLSVNVPLYMHWGSAAPWGIFKFKAACPTLWLTKQSDNKQLLFINFIEGVLDNSWKDSKEMVKVCRMKLKVNTQQSFIFF